MASSALEGFITGFAGKMAENITERKQEARDYFNKQVEYAHTRGLENRRRVRQVVDANLAIAQQLKAAGLPEDLIMAQINANPNGLGDLQAEVEKIRSSVTTPMTEEQWRAYYKVSGDFKAPDEDLASVIRRTYDPIVTAASSPDFADDPEGSFSTSLMGFGYDAMDRMRERLGQTMIADGMTAEQLIQYGDGVEPQRIGGQAVITRDYQALPRPEKELSISETTQIATAVDGLAETLISEAETAGSLGEGADATFIRDGIVEEIRNLYPEVPLSTIERLATNALRSRRLFVSGTPAEEMPLTGAESDVEGLPSPETSEGSQTTEMPSKGAPMFSEDKSKIYAPEMLTIMDEALKDENLTESEKQAIQAQRDGFVTAVESGMAVGDMFADSYALLNRIGARLVEYGVGYPLAMVSPETATGVFDWVREADKVANKAATTFERPVTSEVPLVMEAPKGGPNPTLKVPNEQGNLVTLSFVKDNGDGTSEWIDSTGSRQILDNKKIQEVFK